MPNFTAYAAHEAAGFALLHPVPEEIASLRRHLRALHPEAPTAPHPGLLAADAALKSAAEAATTARALTGVARTCAVGAAGDQIRAAVQQAARAICTVEPTAARFRGTDMPVTPETITAAALAYIRAEAEPEEIEAIGQGTPMVLVRCSSDRKLGWEITARITAGVRTAQWWMEAHPPLVLRFRRLDGRLGAADNARRLLWRKNPAKRYLAVTDVPVEFCNDPRV
ncbi:hypothetical protein [Streptomyces sp. NPDC046925]|uniref:hypothetical protein n=1 Tax=Streptomyces sp. NPDC046925 TaxID=3155375 RepID=UPI0033E53F14